MTDRGYWVRMVMLVCLVVVRSVLAEPPSRNDIRRVQELLTVRGYKLGSIDGQLGSRTRAAICAFQEKEGLPITGEISKDLIVRLQRLAAISPKSQTNEMPDIKSLTVKTDIAVLKELGPRAGFGGGVLINRLVKGPDGRITGIVEILSVNEKAADYLDQNLGKIKIWELYPEGKNIYKMPSFVLHATKSNPIDINTLKSHLMMDQKLIMELDKSKKIEGGKLIDDLSFSAIEFKKRNDNPFEGKYEVVGWIPTYLINNFVKGKRSQGKLIKNQQVNFLGFAHRFC
jgi:hypothetical protein